MSNSPLVDYVKLSPNRNSPRQNKILVITPHCYVGQATVESAGAWFSKRSTGASCNYFIAFDGKKALFVDEKDRSWCTSSKENDHMAITIEVASDRTPPYEITPAAYQALIDLCADICKRNGIPGLSWCGDKSLIGQPDKQNITVHRWFANKACPGDYIYNRLGEIAEAVNKKLEEERDLNKDETLELMRENFSMLMDEYLAKNREKPAPEWNEEDWEVATAAGIFDGTAPQNPLTRGQAAATYRRMGLLDKKGGE